MVRNKPLTLLRKVSLPILILGLFSMGVFFCNHNALFISDYYLLLLFFLISAFFLLLNRNVPLKFNIHVFGISILFIIMAVMSIINRNLIDLGTLKSYIIWFLVYIVAVQIPVTKYDITFLIWSLIIGSLICSLLILVFRHEYGYVGSGRYSIQIFSQSEMDPNYLASYLVIGGVLALYKVFEKNKLRNKILLLAFFFIISMAIIITGSRAGVISYVIALLGCLSKLLYNNQHKLSLKKVFILILIIIIALAVTISVLPQNIVERIFYMDLKDGSNSLRISHWIAALECFVKKPVFGYGPMHTVTILKDFANHIGDAHNTYLTYLLQFGLIGFFAMAMIIIDLFRGLLTKSNIVFAFLLLGQLFASLIIANHLGISFWITIILCYFIVRQSRFERKNIYREIGNKIDVEVVHVSVTSTD